MAQVKGQFEIKQFYRESISTAFKADKVRLAAALFGGVIGYGLLRRLEVGRFVSLSIGSAPVIAYATCSLHRAQIQMGAAALIGQKVQAEELPAWIRRASVNQKAANDQKIEAAFHSPISKFQDGNLYRIALLIALPEVEGPALIQETPGLEGESVEAVVAHARLSHFDQLTMNTPLVKALFARHGWQKDQVEPSSLGQVVAALRLLHEHRERLPLLSHHLQVGYLQGDEYQLLQGGRGREGAQCDYRARNAEIRAAIAPTYQYTQVCPDRISRVRRLSESYQLEIFAWQWRERNDEGKRAMLQAIKCPLLVEREIDGVLPKKPTGHYSPPPTVSREATMAFLAMKGRPRFFGDQHSSFSVGCVALAGLILDLDSDEKKDFRLNRQGLEEQLINDCGVNPQVLDGQLLGQAINLLQLGQPSNSPGE